MTKYIIQKAVSPDKVIKANRLSLREMENKFLAQPKYDGCCAIMAFASCASYVVSRTGEYVQSLETIRAEIENILQPSEQYVFIGEAWNPFLLFNEISGEFRRHKDSSNLNFVINDCIPFDDFEQGVCSIPYYERYRIACDLIRRCDQSKIYVTGYYRPRYNISELVSKYTAIPGYDGIVLKDPLGKWKAGNGTTGEIIKIKNKLSYDLRVIGTVSGKGKHAAKIGSLVVDFNGSALGVGTGLTDQERELPEDYWIGKIVEVEAMTFSSDGLLREPRYKGIRYDKLEADTTC